MSPLDSKNESPVCLICGEDDFAVKQRAKELFLKWSQEIGGEDHEMIEASVSNSSDALRVIGRLREALRTLPFFGGGKVVWFRDCNFLAEDKTSGSSAVTEALSELSEELKGFNWQGVRLLLSAIKVDKRKTFFKTLDKIGRIENFDGWSSDDKNWPAQAELMARKLIESQAKHIDTEAINELVARIGPQPRQIATEVEKVCLFVGERETITKADVAAVCSKNKLARQFALGDSLGSRKLPDLLKCLDEELWEMQFDKQKNEIGMLYGLISKVRVMLMLKGMMREGWINKSGDYNSLKAQLSKVSPAKLPSDRKYNPLTLNPYVLFRAMDHAKNYSEEELVKAMELLLSANRRLVSSQTDERIVLQQTLVQIVGAPATSAVGMRVAA